MQADGVEPPDPLKGMRLQRIPLPLRDKLANRKYIWLVISQTIGLSMLSYIKRPFKVLCLLPLPKLVLLPGLTPG